jgi:dipeptidyl aminopeptidase/acylaminoacyl peptidase
MRLRLERGGPRYNPRSASDGSLSPQYVFAEGYEVKLLRLSLLVSLAMMCTSCSVTLGTGPSDSAPTGEASPRTDTIDLSTLPGTIAFTSFMNDPRSECGAECNSDIFVMRPDGSELTELTQGPMLDAGPAFSPDGTTIAFSREDPTTHRSDLWLMNADGTDPRRLTIRGSNEFGAQWSPDGSHLVFHREPSNAREQEYTIWTIDIGSGGLERVTGVDDLRMWPFADIFPSSSGNGSVAFIRWDIPTPTYNRLCIRDSSLGALTCLDTDHRFGTPRWSPDGS